MSNEEEQPTPMEVSEEVAADEAPAEVKSSPKKRKKPEPTVASRRSGRARKKTTLQNIGHAETKVQELPEGPGTQFQDIPLIAGRINAASFTSDNMIGKKLYRICFGQASKKINLKKHLRLFSGFNEETADADVKKLTVWCTKNCDVANHLKPILGLLGLQVTGTKEELVDRLLSFLRSPEDSGAQYTPFSMGKKKSTKKKSKKKASAPRKKSGYMLYLGEHRAAYKKKHPEQSMVEVTQGLAAKWGKLTDAQKEEWKEKAASLPAPSPKKKTTKKKATKKKAKKKAVSASEEESESEEESSDEDAPLGDDVEDRLEAAVKEIVNAGDLSQLTKGKIRKLLAPEFGDAVGENKAHIKACIKKYTAIKLKSAEA